MNNVAQEWAWNWHFLEPDFLNEHEETLRAGSLTGRFLFFGKNTPLQNEGGWTTIKWSFGSDHFPFQTDDF